MKILMMTNTYTPIVGGLEKSILVFSEQFRLKGHEVKIIAPEFENMPEKEKDVIRVPSIENVIGTDFSVGLPLPEIIQDLIEDFKPDIIHSHHPFIMGDLALRVSRQYQIPLVFTYHTMFEHYTKYFGLDNPAMQKFVVEVATGYANMADHLIVPSESVAQVLQGRGVRTPTTVVPTGLDVNYFSAQTTRFREEFDIPEKAFVVGHVGRLSPEKNLEFLTESVTEFLARHKDARFLIVGSGPSEREMKKIMRSKNVLDRAHFAGVHGGKTLVEAYHAMNVFAFASKSETQGMVVTEAMASGLPVVALDASGVREVVCDKKNGRILKDESAEEFSQALSWIKSRSAVQRNTLKKEALKTARSFSSEICADKALKVYEDVHGSVKVPSRAQWRAWAALGGRLKTEFRLLFNFGKAAGSAVIQAAAISNPLKEKVVQSYQKRVKEFVDNWTLSLKRSRRKLSRADKAKTENGKGEETIIKQIRAFESDLTELSRKVAQACEAFEKRLHEADHALKKELKSDRSAP